MERAGRVLAFAHEALEDCRDFFDSEAGVVRAFCVLIGVETSGRIEKEMYRRIEKYAAREDETLRGVVINVLDQKLYNLNPDYLSYTLSKAALQTATVTLAQALAPKVRVVGIAPGLTLQSADQTPDDFAQAHRVTPLGRASTPEDIVAAACYLAEAGGVTGATLVVDGGQHLVPLPRDVMFLTR